MRGPDVASPREPAPVASHGRDGDPNRVAVGSIRASACRWVRACSPSGGLNDTPVQMNLQSQAKKFENRKGRSFSSPSIPRMFEILQGCTLARIMFLEKKKQLRFCKGEASH
jgi:hypothetical protein